MRDKSIFVILIGILLNIQLFAEDWPQWRDPNRDGVWLEKGIVERFDEPQLPVLWRAEIANGYSGPTVADGRVYVTDRSASPKEVERVWESLDAVPEARWANIHMVRHEDKIWMFNERGELIICKLSHEVFYEISRAKIIEPTEGQLDRRGGVCWAHPAFAYKHVYVRNDRELFCIDLSIKE